MRVGDGPQHHGIGDGVDSGGGADADGQGDGGEREDATGVTP
jgi:hypothetical protein